MTDLKATGGRGHGHDYGQWSSAGGVRLPPRRGVSPASAGTRGIGMRAVVQRVKEAWVRVDEEEVARIGVGLLILVGVAADDGPEDVAFLAQKLAHLRVFAGDGRLMHLSLLDLKAEVLLVSQFTILGDCRKGRRPSFDAAATPETAEKLYEDLVQVMAGYGLPVATGRFRQMMDVGLINDGPVTLLIDSKKVF